MTDLPTGKNNLSSFIYGFRSFFDGLSMLREYSLHRYVIVPALLSMITYGFLWYYLFGFVTELIASTLSGFGYSPEGFMVFVLSVAGFFAAGLLVILTYRLIAALVVVPFLGPLLTRAEVILIGRTLDTTLAQDIRNTWLGVLVGLQFSVAGIIIWIFSLFLGPLQLPIVALAESYFLGRQAMDYVYEKETANLSERSNIAKSNLASIMGLGLAFFLFLWIPFIGVFLGHAAGVCGAAILRHGKNEMMLTHRVK